VFFCYPENAEDKGEDMRLESISKIFGILAFIGFVLAVLRVVGIIGDLGTSGSVNITNIVIGMPIIFLLAAILVTLKRIARDIEGNKEE
jgi:hypothetical protein